MGFFLGIWAVLLAVLVYGTGWKLGEKLERLMNNLCDVGTGDTELEKKRQKQK